MYLGETLAWFLICYSEEEFEIGSSSQSHPITTLLKSTLLLLEGRKKKVVFQYQVGDRYAKIQTHGEKHSGKTA